MDHILIDDFISHSIDRMEDNTKKIQKCFEDLDEIEIWKRPNPSSNSVGNLILHLCGNIRQYILSSLGGQEDIRERDREFSTPGGLTKAELQEKLFKIVADAIDIIRAVDQENLIKIRSVQGFSQSGLGIIIHVVEHYSYHTGQIIFWTKLLKDKDMGFYKGIDLNKKNEL